MDYNFSVCEKKTVVGRAKSWIELGGRVKPLIGEESFSITCLVCFKEKTKCGSYTEKVEDIEKLYITKLKRNKVICLLNNSRLNFVLMNNIGQVIGLNEI